MARMTYDPRMAYDPERKLSDGDVAELKPEGWWGDGGKLFRVFPFENFAESVAFAVRVAAQAEERGHHPDIHIKSHSVKVNFFTYAAGGVTELDLAAARAVNGLLEP